MKHIFLSVLSFTIYLNSAEIMAAESQMDSSSQWTTSYNQEKMVTTISSEYIPFVTLENTSKEPSLKEIMIEISPHYTKDAQRFDIIVKDFEGIDYGIRSGPSRIAINFTPKNKELATQFHEFLVKKYGNEFSWGFKEYNWTSFYVHGNQKRYACVSFSLFDHEKIKTVFEKLASLAKFSEADEAVLNQVYHDIEKRITITA